MKAAVRIILPALALVATSLIALSAPVAAQVQNQTPPVIKEGRQLEHDGKVADVLALYEKSLKDDPNSYGVHIAAGEVLDLLGRHDEARQHFEQAIAHADSVERRAMGQRAEAMSYAFEGNCSETSRLEEELISYYRGIGDFYQQGEMADEAARVCLDSGDFDAAENLYRRGHDLGMQEPNIKPARVDLWNFRWENAQARIAIRRGNRAESERHVAAAETLLNKGTNPEQAAFLPALKGYVDFYAGDYKSALDQLQKANQHDAFIQCLLAQTYEKLGDQAKALDFYGQAASAFTHNPPAAYAVPFSKKKLSEWKG
jgi:tetratricopeptide (TPR) repeat protein